MLSDTTIYLPEDVERLTGVTVLGQIPDINVASGNYTYWTLTEGGAVSIRSVYRTAAYMKRINNKLLSNQITSLGLGALLICMPEPVIDANPYFFFAVLMLLGGIKGLERRGKDIAKTERRF